MEEYAESLHNYIYDTKRYIPRYFYLSWSYGIANGMYYLHNNKVIHRDLKSDKYINIYEWSILQIISILLAFNGAVKIGDLDRACVCHHEGLPMFVEGSYRFMAPEYLAPSRMNIACDEKVMY